MGRHPAKVIKRGLLALADISGDTHVTRLRVPSRLDAEEINSGLLEAVIDKAACLPQIAKLERDAVFLFRRARRPGRRGAGRGQTGDPLL